MLKQTSATRQQLGAHGLTDERDITTLVQCNLLLIRDEWSFWLSAPGMGAVSGLLHRGRHELRKVLLRKPCHEVAEQVLNIAFLCIYCMSSSGI